MDGKINVEFSEEEFDLIMKYMEASEAVTVQAAILNAISIALDDDDRIVEESSTVAKDFKGDDE